MEPRRRPDELEEPYGARSFINIINHISTTSSTHQPPTITMKFSTIAFGVAAFFTASAMAAPAAGSSLEVREVDANNILEVAALMARDDLVKRNCSNCAGKIKTCCSVNACYTMKC
ncbi:hypothetical protein F5X68DRAFT_231068 [Plectosphaerella plurivora]|uniref:Uncharacterized protein n=1 Tax=Plectosphaerella plurivora TaxID=936078 RepID=A0A9P8VE84_9PEZI|nr:hypothetical protein F5X68DRAFT_231068 [Plectosphaerella plurivora]